MVKLSNYFFFKIKILTSYLKGCYWQVMLPLRTTFVHIYKIKQLKQKSFKVPLSWLISSSPLILYAFYALQLQKIFDWQSKLLTIIKQDVIVLPKSFMPHSNHKVLWPLLDAGFVVVFFASVCFYNIFFFNIEATLSFSHHWLMGTRWIPRSMTKGTPTLPVLKYLYYLIWHWDI